MGDEFEFKIIQGEIVVAEGSGPNGDAVYVEAMHYARQYAEDGPCIVRLSRSQSIAISKSGFVERNDALELRTLAPDGMVGRI